MVFLLAYVMVSVTDGFERELVAKLQSFPEVEEVHILFGEWDVIAKIRTDTPEHAASFVMENIRSFPHVKLTSTLIVAS